MSFCPSLNWRERGLPKPGLKPNEEEVALAERFGVHIRRVQLQGVRRLNDCADDSARRLLLGCSIKNGPGD